MIVQYSNRWHIIYIIEVPNCAYEGAEVPEVSDASTIGYDCGSTYIVYEFFFHFSFKLFSDVPKTGYFLRKLSSSKT